MSKTEPYPHKNYAVEDPTDEELDAIWDEFDIFVVSMGSGVSVKRFHLPNGEGERLCSETESITNGDPEWRSKDVSCYPVGWHPVCKFCLRLWRNEQ